MLRAFPSAVIENLEPLIDGARYPIKRVIGEDLMVEADIFKEGHDVVAAALKWRMVGETRWHETPMKLIVNDRWRGACTFYENAIYEYTVEAWIDAFTSWQHEFSTKFKAGVFPLRSDALEGAALIEDAKAMGFNVIYFPPIHPIGTTNRKGRNNSVNCGPDDPGVPYAIGNRHLGCPNGGGHKDIDPALGALEDFTWLEEETRKRGLEIALDFAINCSPDHPYVAEHPEWFYERPDGTIKFAENPPKKYEDIYPLNFRCANWAELWAEMKSIILFWVERGVRIFRVDNPHTKPLPFWEYLISGVRDEFPDTIFLSEAFTRPKMMKVLAKAGFNQSYTYFTWRTYKQELIEYFSELTQTEMREYFRVNLWPNTPDILPPILQNGGHPAFMIRAVLAATLSSVYGIYSGFELCENAALPGREEYLDSEKYQFKHRDWDAPGNIKDFIARLNTIRNQNRALQFYDNLRFYNAENGAILFYGKTTPARENLIFVVVNLDPYRRQNSMIDVPIELFGQNEGEPYEVHDLLDDSRYTWYGRRNYVELDPVVRPAHIFRLRRFGGALVAR